MTRGIGVLPAAYGADLGINWKPVPRLYVNAGVWYLFLEQELTYDGDEGVFAPGDRTRRAGIDISARYELTPWLYADADLIFCRARDVEASKGNNYQPLSVPFYGTAGQYVNLPDGFSGGWNARYMRDRPANADNSMVAQGYFLNDLTANYTTRRWEIGLEVQNLFNAKWKDAQYEVESRLRQEPAAGGRYQFYAGDAVFCEDEAGGLFLIFCGTAAVLGFLTTGGETFVGVGFCRDVICVIPNVGDQRLDIFDIGAIGLIGHRSDLLFIIDIDLDDAVFMAHIIFDTGFAFFALYRRSLYHGGQLGFQLGGSRTHHADEDEEEKMDFFHNDGIYLSKDKNFLGRFCDRKGERVGRIIGRSRRRGRRSISARCFHHEGLRDHFPSRG